MSSMPYIGEIASIASALVWAMAIVLFTRRSATLSAYSMNLFKCGLATAFYVPTLLIIRGASVLEGFEWRESLMLAAGGVSGMAIGDMFLFLSLPLMGAARAMLVTMISPILVAALSRIFLHDPLELMEWTGVIVTVAGVSLVLWGDREDLPGARFTRKGLVLGLLASFFFAIGMILTKVGLVRTSAVEGSFVRVAAAFVVLLFAAPLARGRRTLPIGAAKRFSRMENPLAVFARGLKDRTLLTASTLGTYIGFLFFVAGIKYAHPGIVSALSSTSPLFILPLARFFLGERITPFGVAGTFVAVLGIVLLFAV